MPLGRTSEAQAKRKRITNADNTNHNRSLARHSTIPQQEAMALGRFDSLAAMHEIS